MTFLNEALRYAEIGWKVLPLHSVKNGRCTCGKACKSPGKHPLTLNGLKDASFDLARIKTWFKNSPYANIGVVTGAESGIFVLDVDPKNGGLDSVDRLINEHGPIPDDVLAVTGSGGNHYVFKYPGELGRSSTNIWPGIDTRGDGGYIVVAPSRHISGDDYFWDAEADPLAGAIAGSTPSWLLDKLKAPKVIKPALNEYVLSVDKVKRIRSALCYVPADDREAWLTVGMALHSVGDGSQSFGLWAEWSQQSDKFDLKDQRRVWSSFNPGSVTIASLYNLAKQHGFVFISDRPPEPPVDIYEDDITKYEDSVDAKNRDAFEQEIKAAGNDFDKLLSIVSEVNNSKLHNAEKEYLLKLVSKTLRVSVASLKNGGGGNYSEEFVDELNSKHAVTQVAGRAYVMNQEYDPELNRNLVTLSSSQDFCMRYQNRKSNGSDIGSTWLNHPKRRQYEGIVFAPGKQVDGFFNLFQGFGVEANELGSCDLFVNFIREIICNNDEQLFSYLWCWLAHLFQKPMELPGTSMVLRGKQGIGKNTFVDTIGALVNQAHYLSLNNLQQVTGRFSGHLADVLLVFANEAIWGGDKSAEGALKAMVTDSMQAIERKGKDIVAMRNYKRLIVASNEDWVIPRGMDDRRFVVVDVSDTRKEDQLFFKNIWNELNNGGRENLMHRLLSTDISSYNPRVIPGKIREYGWELKIQSGGSIMQWWFDVLDRGYLIKVDQEYGEDFDYVWPDKMCKQTVHNFYLKWCDSHKVGHPEVDSVMGRKLKQWGVAAIRTRATKRIPHYAFDNLDQSRAVFAHVCGIPINYWADTE